jgi:DNA-binding response OmpR family regulator
MEPTSTPRHLEDCPAPEHARRVLIVDDEAPVRHFVDRVLRQAGYATIVAENGASALATFAEQGPFDILVTDLRMPKLAGDELARQLRLRQPDLKVLYLTGHSDELFESRGTLWADEAYLEKPQTMAGLREAVSLLLFGSTRAPGH